MASHNKDDNIHMGPTAVAPAQREPPTVTQHAEQYNSSYTAYPAPHRGYGGGPGGGGDGGGDGGGCGYYPPSEFVWGAGGDSYYGGGPGGGGYGSGGGLDLTAASTFPTYCRRAYHHGYRRAR